MLSAVNVRSNFAALRASARNRGEAGFENRPSLQLIVLLMAWWVAVSMGWIGSPLWIWVGGGLLITAGHSFSWLLRNSRSPLRAAAVAIAIVASLALVPNTIMMALSGNWLPVAHFLLLFQGVTSFEMRTRGGLYASLGLSGAIFFFVSQQALDLTFVVFLTGFTTLLLSFFALSYLIDQVHDSDVNWFKGKYSFSMFWTGVFVVSMLISAAIFMMLPKDLRDPVESAQAVVLPMRARGDTQLPEISTNPGDLASALPLTAEDDFQTPSLDELLQDSEELLPQFDPESEEGEASQGQPGGDDGMIVTEEPVPDGTRSLEGQEDIPPIPQESLVMQVRSPVMTYWREQVYDSFDGAKWHPDPTYLTLTSSNSNRSIYAAPQPPGLRTRPLYNQTYFINQAITSDSIFTGYSPMVATVPVVEGDDSLSEGTVYRVISAIPEFNSGGLSRATPTSRLEFRYHELPDSARILEGLARQITIDARSDIERVRRIVAFLDRSYEFDLTAPDQQALSAPPVEFLTENSTGTTMDFATATVLLARASDIPARLVSGYLPGQFDPLSGTYMVREKDRHTWAEVFFGGVGWVPFDSTPSPSTNQFGEGGTYEPNSVNALFGTAYGDEIYDTVRSSPQEFMELVKDGFERSSSGAFALAALTAAAALGFLFYWRIIPLLRDRTGKLRYSRIDGDGRSEMLRIYSRAEKLLAKSGIVPRDAAETLEEYSGRAEPALGNARADFTWIRNETWKAAYGPARYDAGILAEAKRRLDSLNSSLKRNPANESL